MTDRCGSDWSRDGWHSNGFITSRHVLDLITFCFLCFYQRTKLFPPQCTPTCLLAPLQPSTTCIQPSKIMNLIFPATLSLPIKWFATQSYEDVPECSLIPCVCAFILSSLKGVCIYHLCRHAEALLINSWL